MKRLFDLFIAVISCFLLLPFFILAAIIVISADGFPIFYTQNRVGLKGKGFKLIKFRSMKRNSEKLGFTTFKNDDRIFLGGKFLRKYKIDELAQLINVLKGEMSIVGPRPTVPDDFNKMTEEQQKRCNVLPGLTGLAQISGNTSLKWPERITLDLEYIEKQSIFYDFKIIVKTLVMILKNKIDSETSEEGEW